MAKPLTIIVGGYIVGFPLGGMTWHHLNYVLGLAELGHDVWFYEFGSWPPYNPVVQRCEWDHHYGTQYLGRQMREYGVPGRWCYQTEHEVHNMRRGELVELFGRADLIMCVSGVTPLRSDLPRPRRTLVIDTDPVFTQLRMQQDAALLEYYRQFDRVATFGRLIGTPECPLPTHGIDWVPTHQPIALQHWPVTATQSETLTTIGKWEHTAERHVEFAGEKYLSSKGVEWMKMIDLPRKTDWRMSIAISSMPDALKRDFEQHGWLLGDAEAATVDCRSFAKFIQRSAGEFTVAKQIYAGLPSGWFSDRSACYLASRRPVVTQASGFDRWLPVGEGLFSFNTADEAAEALRAIREDYPRHAAGARKIAEEFFDSKKVLRELIDVATS